MASIVIVSGSPGSGKSTLANALAQSAADGLHLHSDVFYKFPVRLVDPTRPESRNQNTTIMRALARAARAFAEGGYEVFLDGVIGPWFLPVFGEEFSGGPAVSYVVLRVSEAEALRRVRDRQGAGASPAVRHMTAAFAEADGMRGYGIDTTERSAQEVADLAREGLRTGRYALRWDAAT